MRILICGSRDYTNKQRIREAILFYKPPVVIEGEARGADTLARKVAEELGIEIAKNSKGERGFPADWNKYGKAAGPIRNKQMLDEGKPDLVLAFFSGKYEDSKGTKNMVEQAIAASVIVLVMDREGLHLEKQS